MKINLFNTSKSALSYGSTISGKILSVDNNYILIKLLSNGLEIKIPRKDIEYTVHETDEKGLV